MVVRFGEYEFDPDARTLRKLGQAVHLTPRAFNLLAALAERRPQPVPEPELICRLWPDTFVSQGSLANVVLELRRALDDRRPPRLIKTIHRVGYALAGETAPAQTGRFCLLIRDKEVRLHQGENWIGRSLDCHVQVNCSRASRRHARITIADNKATLEDMGSRNGTFLCRERLQAPAVLENRDWIEVGSVRLDVLIVLHDTPTDED